MRNKKNRRTKKEVHELKEELILSVFVLMFFLGFFALINFDSGVTGFDIGFSDNFTTPVEIIKNFALGEEIKLGGNVIGHKIADDPSFEVYFDSISKIDGYLVLDIYHDFNGSLDVWVEAVNEAVNITAPVFENITLIENATSNSTTAGNLTGNETYSNASISFIVTSGLDENASENLQNSSNFDFENETGLTNLTSNLTDILDGNLTNLTGNLTGNLTEKDTLMTQEPGLDSGTDFEVCFGGGNASFVCYKADNMSSTGNHATLMGQGNEKSLGGLGNGTTLTNNLTIKIKLLQNQKIPHFKLYVAKNSGQTVSSESYDPDKSLEELASAQIPSDNSTSNTSEIFEFYETSFDFGTSAIWYGYSTSSTSGKWGSPISPANKTRIQDNLNVNFIFNASSAGIHNLSTMTTDPYIVLNMWMEQNATDISGNGNNGVSGNFDGDENTTGIIGYGYLFDGVNDYIQINIGFNYNTTTIILWINPKDITKDQYVTGRDNKLSLLLGYQDNYFNIFHNGGYITGTASDTQISATQNTWQQIVYSSDSSRVYGYKNGELIINVSGNLNTSGLTDYYLGAGYGTPFFNGSIDEVQIWNRSLSSGEISAIYNDTMYVEDGRQTRYVKNCSLLLNVDSAGYITNQTMINDHNSSNVATDPNIVLNMWMEQNASDISGNGNNGVVTGAVNSSGIVGYGYNFDGVDDYVLINDSNSLHINNFSISLWVYPKKVSGIPNDLAGLITKRNTYATLDWEWYMNSVGGLSFTFGEGVPGSFSRGTLTINNWQHIILTKSGTNYTTYINGISVGSNVATGSWTDSENVRIGCLGADVCTNYAFNGTIDEVQIWNRSLSSGEISAIYNKSKLDAGHNATFTAPFSTCYDEKTEVLTDEGWKFFKNLNGDEEVLTLNTEFIEENYEITEKDIEDWLLYLKETDEDKYYDILESTKGYLEENLDSFGNILTPADERENILPLNSNDFIDLNKFNKDESIGCINGGVILMNIIPEYSSGGNSNLLAKCLSNVNKTLSSDLADFAISLSEEPDKTLLALKPSFFNNSISFTGMFSSHNRFGLLSENDISFLFNCLGSIIQGGKDSFLIELREVIFKNFLDCNSSCKQFSNKINHDSSAFESRLPVADFSICNNVLIKFDSHSADSYEKKYLNVSDEINEKCKGLAIGIDLCPSSMKGEFDSHEENNINGGIYKVSEFILNNEELKNYLASKYLLGKVKLQKPIAYQKYNYTGEMYRIKTIKGDLVVSPEHKIYAAVRNNSQNQRFQDYAKVAEKDYKSNSGNFFLSAFNIPSFTLSANLSACFCVNLDLETILLNSASFCNLSFNGSNKSFVENILTDDCFLNPGSLDQIGQSSLSANAKNGISLSCGANCFALDSNCLNNSEDRNLMHSSNSLSLISNSNDNNLEYFNMSCLLSVNSSIAFSAENNCRLIDLKVVIKNSAAENSLKNPTNILVSTTNFIYQPSFLNFCHIPALIFLPNISASLSGCSDSSSILSSFLSNNNFLTLLDRNSLITSDQFISGNSSILCFNGSETDNVTFGILIPPHNLINTQDTHIYKDFDAEDYTKSKEKNYKDSKNSINSAVVNTGIFDCSLKCGSLDQIEQYSLMASARYGTSFLSDIDGFALFNCCGETFFNLTNLENICFILSNLSSDIFNFEHKTSEYLLSSSSTKECEYNSGLYCLNISLADESFFNKEKAMLASTTNFIYSPSFFNLSHIALLTFLPNSNASLSVNSLCFVNSSNSLSNLIFSSCPSNSSLLTSDQFTQANFLSSFLVCSGMVNTAVGIYITPCFFNSMNFFNSSNLLSMPAFITLFQLTSGNSFFNLSSSFGADIVNVAILVPPYNSVSIHKSVDIYKGIGAVDDYELVRIKDIYPSFNSGEKELWFLDENGEEILVSDIIIEEYSGKIYDVDVPEYDVILVRREGDLNENLTDLTDSFDENYGVISDEKDTLMTQEPGLDSGTDFEEVSETENSKFEGYTGYKRSFAKWHATLMGQGKSPIQGGKKNTNSQPNHHIQNYLTTWSGNSDHDVKWKTGCYDDLGIQWNTTEMSLELNSLSNLTFNPNIGAHAYLDRNYVVGQWRFEENNGTDTLDETGKNNGTLAGGVRWCPDDGDSLGYNCSGRVGRGYLFDGVNDYIILSDPNLVNAGSWGGWVKYSGPTEGSGVIGVIMSQNFYYDGNGIHYENDGGGDGLFCDVWSSSYANKGASYDTGNIAGSWHHVMCVYNGTNTLLYYDGVHRATSTWFNDGLYNYGGAFNLGRAPTLNNVFFNGTIDEVMIWNRSLSAEEIKQLYYSSAESYNSTYTTNDISAAINGTKDLDNDSIKYIYNWYVNNQSIAVLNMPFEAVNNGSEQNFTKDYSGRGNHGTTNFNSNIHTCDAGGVCSGWNRTGGYDGKGAYEFDGSDYIDLGSNIDDNIGNGNRSFSFWFKKLGSISNAGLIGLGDATSRQLWVWNDGNTISFATTDATFLSSTAIVSNNVWTHVAGIYNGTSRVLYVNGVLNNQGASTAKAGTNNNYIGFISGFGKFNGTIDDVLIFNRSLSAEEVLALYKNQSYTIKSQETLKGESWKCEVTANDGYGDSQSLNTSEIVIDSVTLTINNLGPRNISTVETNPVTFTYNISDGDSDAGVFNCSLFLGYASNALVMNQTDYIIELNSSLNNTFSVPFENNQTHQIYWLVGCYDKDNEQTNSSEGVFTLQKNSLVNLTFNPNIGAHAYLDRNYVVGQWRFEENNGTDTLDETGLNNGTLVGGVRWCPDDGDSTTYNCSGRIGRGYLFDGVDDYISVSDNINFSNQITLSAWFNLKGQKYAHDVISKYTGNNGFIMAIYNNPRAYFYLGDGTTFRSLFYDPPSQWYLSGWNNLIFTYNGEFMKIYHNGVLKQTSPSYVFNISLSGTPSLTISSSANFFNGTIDEVTIWNRSLSAEEVRQLYYSSAESYNSTYTTNDISAAINGTSDLDNDSIKYIYNWYVNNQSIAVLNMPFEGVNNGSEMNFTKDYSGRGNHGTTQFNSNVYDAVYHSGWNRTGGYDGKGAYEFDGKDDEITIPHSSSLNITDEITISAWIKPTSLSGTYDIVGKSSGAVSRDQYLLRQSGGEIWFLFRDVDDTIYPIFDSQSVVLTANVWKYVVLTHTYGSSSDTKIYVDGSNISTATWTQGTGNEMPQTSTGSVYVGIHTDGSSNDFNGTIDDVLIFNRSLSQEEVLALYKNQSYTIKSTETLKGESWKCEVTANDGYGDSASLNTSEIVIDSVTLSVHNVGPINNSNLTTRFINFTYNVTDGDSEAGVFNCSLFINDILNVTTNYPDITGINQTFNISLMDGTYTWIIGCYDKDLEQTNSSEGKFTVISSAKPTIQTAKIQPSIMAYTNQTLIGNCSASDPNSNVTYYWTWYKNDVLNLSGVTSINYTQNIQVNVDNITEGNTTIGEEWILSCLASDGVENSSWINSSITIVSDLIISAEALNSFRITEFVTRNGTNFTLGGQPYKFIGTDSYYIADYATNHTYDDDGHEINNSREYTTELLNEMQYLNVNVFRTWAGMQGGGRGSTAWNISTRGGHHNLFEVNVPGNFSEEMYASLDWVIYEASKRDLRVILVLVNNWNDYGGMRWYAQQSPTTTKTYENISDTSLDNYWKFHDQFYNDTNCMTYFKNFTNYTLNRNNTYSGKLYKDDPTILAWILGNEPRAKSDGTETKQLIINWTKNMTAFIKTIDTKHLVGLGIEGWGDPWDGTSFIKDHNGTGVDFATYALHPDQWGWFADRSEGPTNGYWINGAINETSIDWWTNMSSESWNNRYEGSYVPNYQPALSRHGYNDWVRQHVNWSNVLGIPVILQEAAMDTSRNISYKDKFYQQMIHNFFKDGGDGLMFWTLNHDNYYYSTDIAGDMDDGYGFYLSDDAFLKNKSQSVIDAINFTMYDNNGSSWVRLLNNYKYDFIVNAYPQGKHDSSGISDYVVGNYWFENNADDASGNGNDGVVTGAVDTAGAVGYGYLFDGVNDYINTQNILNLSSAGTLSAWIKFSGKEGYDGIISGRATYKEAFSLERESGESVITCFGNSGTASAKTTTSMTNGIWYFITCTNDGSRISAYTNGILEASADYSSIVYSNGLLPYVIGRYYQDSDAHYFNGSIDEVMIWNRSLSATEIENLYETQKYGQPSLSSILNASLLLNIDSTGWVVNQTNASAVDQGVNHTFTTQFGTNQEEFYWEAQWCDDYTNCYNTSSEYILLKTAPLVTLLSPSDNTFYNSGGTKEFNYSAADTLDVNNCQLFIDNILNSTDTTITRDITQTFSIDDFSTQSINYTWRVECTDIGDNLGVSGNRTFTIDIVNPTVNIYEPLNNTNSSSSDITFIYNASDDFSPMDSCILWLYKNDNWELNYTDTSITNDINQSMDISFEEINTLWKIECNDSAGNKDNSTEYNITVDLTAPVVNLQYPADDTTINCIPDISFTYNTSDSPSNIKSCSLFLGYENTNANQLNLSDTAIEESINQTFNITMEVNGTYIYWKVGCYNDVSLQANSSLRKISLGTYCPPYERLPSGAGSSSGGGTSGERKASIITEMMQTLRGNVYSLDYATPGITLFDITNPILSIVKVEVDLNKELEKVSIEISEGKSGIVERPEGNLYRYITIDKINLPDSAINKINIFFKVQKGYGNDIKLLRYTADWQELPTEKTGEDEYYEYYRAESPGLSIFAITSAKEKLNLIKIFAPGLIQDQFTELREKSFFETRLFNYIKGIVAIILIITCLILLLLFVRSRLKRRRQ